MKNNNLVLYIAILIFGVAAPFVFPAFKVQLSILCVLIILAITWNIQGGEMGVFMVLMAILGGKGTLWGPVIGATIFHIFKEGFWTFFLGWQYVALGVLIVVIVIYFPEGIMGWLREKYPEKFGEVVDEADRKAQVELK